MNKEEYVSFEIAKLLKEKGFNEYCCKLYELGDKPILLNGFELDSDVNTADMVYCVELYKEGWKYSNEAYPIDGTLEGDDIPAWSLSALINVLPQGTRLLKSSTDETYHCDCPKGNIDKWFDNSLDAAFEMIVWLKENGKI